jgi:hypothetical protein
MKLACLTTWRKFTDSWESHAPVASQVPPEEYSRPYSDAKHISPLLPAQHRLTPQKRQVPRAEFIQLPAEGPFPTIPRASARTVIVEGSSTDA